MRLHQISTVFMAAVTFIGASAAAITRPEERQSYEAYFTREMSNGFTLFSEKKRMLVVRERYGDEAVTMYDEVNGATGLQSPKQSHGYDLWNPEEHLIDYAYRYDYANKRMYGPEAFTLYFNTYVRPLMLKHGTGAGPSSARFSVPLAQMGLPGLKGDAATFVVSKRYETFEGRRYALVSFEVPAFTYLSARGERLVHWANGATITDEGGGVTYYLAVRHRAAAGAGKTGARPMYSEQASYAVDVDGRALLDLRRFPAGKALMGSSLKGETGRPDHHVRMPTDAEFATMMDRSFFAAATGLTAIGLSVAEGSPNAPGGTSAATNGGNQGDGNMVRAAENAAAIAAQRRKIEEAKKVAQQLAGYVQDLPGMSPQQVQQAANTLKSQGLVAEANNLLRIDSLRNVAKGAPQALENAKAAYDALNKTYVNTIRLAQEARELGNSELANFLHKQAWAWRTENAEALSAAANRVKQASETVKSIGSRLQGAVLDLIGNSSAAQDAVATAGSKVRTGSRVLGGLWAFGTLLNGAEAAENLYDALGLSGMNPGRNEDFAKWEARYIEKGGSNIGWDLLDLTLTGASGDVVNGILNTIRIPSKSATDLLFSYTGMKQGQYDAAAAEADLRLIKHRQFKQIYGKIKGGLSDAQDDLQRIEDSLKNFDRDTERLREYSRKRSEEIREAIRRQNERTKAGGQVEEFEEDYDLPDPNIPGPKYPTLTKEQRDAISKRAKERKAAKEGFRSEGDALEGIFAEFDELESERIRKEELEFQMAELAILTAARRLKDREAWERMKARHPDLDELFGDFIENNMFDYGGGTGRGLSGTVATDLSPYAEWLLGQDIDRLNALARAAGYPNLASALNDWRNLTKKAGDDKFRQWAFEMGAFSGTIGQWASEQQHELARAQVLLGDLLNNSRFIESTAGLTDLAISGTTLSTIFRDFGLEDGDVIEITIQQLGRVLFTQTLTLRNAGTAIETNMRRGVGVVNIKALNEGFASPNTAEITINNVTDGDSVQQYSLRTGENATLRVQVGR